MHRRGGYDLAPVSLTTVDLALEIWIQKQVRDTGISLIGFKYFLEKTRTNDASPPPDH